MRLREATTAHAVGGSAGGRHRALHARGHDTERGGIRGYCVRCACQSSGAAGGLDRHAAGMLCREAAHHKPSIAKSSMTPGNLRLPEGCHPRPSALGEIMNNSSSTSDSSSPRSLNLDGFANDGRSRQEMNLRQVRKVWRADRGKAQCRALDRDWAPFALHPGSAHLHPWELVSTTESQDQRPTPLRRPSRVASLPLQRGSLAV